LKNYEENEWELSVTGLLTEIALVLKLEFVAICFNSAPFHCSASSMTLFFTIFDGSSKIMVEPGEMEANDYIFVDCSTLELAGSFTGRISELFMIIDHHMSIREYGRLCFIFREAPATCKIFFDFLCQKSWQIDAPTANV
jgi:hypothetical protein